jgi:uncharacterized lipoprotein YddW (UPF0748 family)
MLTMIPPDETPTPLPDRRSASPLPGAAEDAASGGPGVAASDPSLSPSPAQQAPRAAAGQPPPPEFRAAWVDAWHEGFLSGVQVTQLVNTLQAAHYNLIIAQVRKSGDAYYRSEYEPRASNIADGPAFDPLADLITKAHAAGMQVYAWLETYSIWSEQWPAPPTGHAWNRHPEWAMKDRSGQMISEGHYSLDPGVPGVQDYICRVALDMIAQYDVDGINWDRIRYPEGYYWGYNEITAIRFFDEYGYWPPEERSDPTWESWADYRRQQITDLLKKCSLEIVARKPLLVVSVDTVAWLDPDPQTYYTRSSQFAAVYQDARAWLEQHLVDVLVQMNYKNENDAAQAANYRLWSNFAGQLARASGRYCLDGQAAYLNSVPGTLAQMAYVRQSGCQGAATYSYGSTNRDGRPAGELWDAVRTQLYGLPASAPEMPWKQSPTGGILFGTLTHSGQPDPIYESWVYGAAVTASAAVTATAADKAAPVVTYNARSDATGTYGLLDLPPGTYDLRIAGPGQAVRMCDGVVIRAGDVVRKDFQLEPAAW